LVEHPDLPEGFGTIKTAYKGAGEHLIVAIQDAHINEEAQRNIGNILRYYAGKYQLGLVNLEGSSGELYTDLFSFFPDQNARRNVADYFLREGRFTGPEHLAVVERPVMQLYGVEDPELYEQNRAAYVEALEFKGRDEEVLVALSKVLEYMTRFVFSEEIRELIRRRAAFQEGGRELVAYVRFLMEMAKKHGLNLDGYAGMNSLVRLVDLEKQIDFEKAEAETDALINELKRVLPRENLTRFLANTVHYRMKKMKRAAYYTYLEEMIQGVSVTQTAGEALTTKYANVVAYIEYMKLYDSVGVALFDEIAVLEKDVKTKLFTTPEEVKLDHLLRVYEVMNNLFAFTMTKQDAEFYYTHQDDFKATAFSGFLKPLIQKYHFSLGLPSQMEILDQDLPRAERFYKAALERDQVLIERAVEKTISSGQKISAIVTGGFHTPGIEKYLQEKGLSYIVVTPRISKAFDKKKESALYDAALRETPLPVEKVLSEVFLQPRTGVLNDPRFQLAPESGVPTRSELREGTNLGLARSEVRMSAIESIFAAQDAKKVMEDIGEAVKTLDPEGQTFVNELLKDYQGAYLDGNKLWLLNGTHVGAIVKAGEKAKSREVKLPGTRQGSEINMPAGYRFIVYPEVKEVAVPENIMATHRQNFPLATAQVGPVSATIGVIPTAAIPAAEPEIIAEAEQTPAQQAEQARFDANLKLFFDAQYSVPANVDTAKTSDLTVQEQAFRKILLNRNFQAKMDALKEVGTEGLSNNVILRLLLRSSPEAIRAKIPLLRKAVELGTNIKISTETVSLTTDAINALIEERNAAIAAEAQAKAEAEKAAREAAAKAEEKPTLNTVLKKILAKYEGKTLPSMKGLPKLGLKADATAVIGRIKAEFGFDEEDLSMLAQIAGFSGGTVSQWRYIYGELERAYESVVNFRAAQKAAAKKSATEEMNLIEKAGYSVWRGAKWIVFVGPHLLDQFFFGYYRRKISFYWFRSSRQPIDRRLSVEVLAGAMINATKPNMGRLFLDWQNGTAAERVIYQTALRHAPVVGLINRIQYTGAYRTLSKVFIEPVLVPTLQFIQKRWKLALFGAIGVGLVTFFLPAGLAGLGLLGPLGAWLLSATSGVPILGIVAGAFVHAFTLSSILNTAILSFLLTVPNFSKKYTNIRTDDAILGQLRALNNLNEQQKAAGKRLDLDYLAVRQLAAQVLASDVTGKAQMLKELQAVLPYVRYHSDVEKTLLGELLNAELKTIEEQEQPEARAPPQPRLAPSWFKQLVVYPLIGIWKTLASNPFAKKGFYFAWAKTTWGMMVVGSEIALLAGGYQPGELGAAQYIDQGISWVASQVTGDDVSISLVSHPVLFVEHNAINWGHNLLSWVETHSGFEVSSLTMRGSAALMSVFGLHTEAGDLALDGWGTTEIANYQYARQ
ncbi:MAG: hypothetical protein KTQ49_08150, partial [Candidatus Omnitrophica bacterium]|nr:hypothetical protein [Candidatus Omnitrophota bacterium]